MRESRYTTATAPSAPANARTFTSPNSRMRVRTGTTTAIAAPSAAPEAVPSTYGSASGLRRRPWNAAPATARPTPTVIAVRTRGRRRSKTIVSCAGVQVTGRSSPSRWWPRIAMVWPGGTATEPAATPAMSATTSATSPIARRISGRPPGPLIAARPRPAAGTEPAAGAVASLRRGMGSGGHRERGSDGARGHGVSGGGRGGGVGGRHRRMDRSNQRREPVDEPGTRPRDDDVVDRHDSALLDGGHHAPARPRLHRVGGRPVGGVAEQDDLRIGRDELLQGDGVVRFAADRIGARELEDLAVDRLGGRREDPARGVDLVEHSRLGAA